MILSFSRPAAGSVASADPADGRGRPGHGKEACRRPGEPEYLPRIGFRTPEPSKIGGHARERDVCTVIHQFPHWAPAQQDTHVSEARQPGARPRRETRASSAGAQPAPTHLPQSRQAAECNREKGEARVALGAQRDPHTGVQRDFLKLGFCIQNAPFTQPRAYSNRSFQGPQPAC